MHSTVTLIVARLANLAKISSALVVSTAPAATHKEAAAVTEQINSRS